MIKTLIGRDAFTPLVIGLKRGLGLLLGSHIINSIYIDNHKYADFYESYKETFFSAVDPRSGSSFRCVHITPVRIGEFWTPSFRVSNPVLD